MPEALACKNHSNVTTRLRCPECGEPVCGQCTVQYEVAFKCTDCAREYTSHAVQVTPRQLVIAAVMGGLVGFAFGWIHPWLPNVFLALILSYVLGLLAGKLVHRAVRYNLNPKIAQLATLTLILGLVFSPWWNTFMGLWISILAGVPLGFGLLLHGLWAIGSPMVFIFCVQRVLKTP